MFMLMVKDSLEVQKQRFQRQCVFVGNDCIEVARELESVESQAGKGIRDSSAKSRTSSMPTFQD
jgi:hypothetical protein